MLSKAYERLPIWDRRRPKSTSSPLAIIIASLNPFTSKNASRQIKELAVIKY